MIPRFYEDFAYVPFFSYSFQIYRLMTFRSELRKIFSVYDEIITVSLQIHFQHTIGIWDQGMPSMPTELERNGIC
jgi:hypothetical protein